MEIMKMKEKEEKKAVVRDEKDLREHIEDTSKYGEFISTYFAWVSPIAQKKNVERLENITKDNKGKEEK